MKRISEAAVGVQTGSVVLFSAFENDGEMWTGSGARRATYHVSFDEPFDDTPAVHISLSMWDTEGSTNQRLDVQATEINPQGFVIEFRTWGDSRVARVRASWMAIGSVAYQDEWMDD